MKWMEEVWLPNVEGTPSRVSCAHPGANVILGRGDVLASWGVICQSPTDVTIDNVKVSMYACMHVCIYYHDVIPI